MELQEKYGKLWLNALYNTSHEEYDQLLDTIRFFYSEMAGGAHP